MAPREVRVAILLPFGLLVVLLVTYPAIADVRAWSMDGAQVTGKHPHGAKQPRALTPAASPCGGSGGARSGPQAGGVVAGYGDYGPAGTAQQHLPDGLARPSLLIANKVRAYYRATESAATWASTRSRRPAASWPDTATTDLQGPPSSTSPTGWRGPVS